MSRSRDAWNRITEPRRRRAPFPGRLRRPGVVVVVCLACLTLARPSQTQGTGADAGTSLPDVVEAIQRARVATRVLYVTAHPDDESSSILTYLARGLGAEVALLSLTRGEGGQNALGPEIGPRLGRLRTEELLAATQRYGVQLYFTRASDFGYSKTPEETMAVWGDEVVADLVQVIRTFRPHVVINGWGGTRSGHGHHQAAGRLTPQAFAAAADPRAFPGQLRGGVEAWRTGHLLHVVRGDASGSVRIPSDEVSPLWGRSYNEIGLEGFVNHRTQGIVGFRSSPFFRATRALVPAKGERFALEQLAQPLGWLAARFPAFAGVARPALENADKELEAARGAALRLDWPASTRHLAAAGNIVARLRRQVASERRSDAAELLQEIERLQERVDEALALAAGLRIDVLADRSEIVAGESFTVRAQARCRPGVACVLGEMRIQAPAGMKAGPGEGDAKSGFHFTVRVEPEAQPEPRPQEWMLPLPAPLVTLRLHVSAKAGPGGAATYTFARQVPVAAERATSTRVDMIPLRIVPAVTLSVEPGSFVVASGRAPARLEVVARVRHHGTSAVEVLPGIEAPPGWNVSGLARLAFAGPGDQLAKFTVVLPQPLASGTYTLKAYARRATDTAEFRTSLEPLPTLPAHLWSEPAAVRAHVLDLVVPENLRVGYIAAANDPIPDVLRQLGIQVEMLDEVALAFGDLKRFDAIAVGIRAYELRHDLIRSNRRLLDYAAGGGTLVVQYQRETEWNRLQPTPFPASVGQPAIRVSVENSPVRLLAPDHPALKVPNAITAADFEGWVQERGLYFWSEFDARYQPLLGLRDPGEAETTGGLVYARYGQGVYLYTGLSFFRQLPEGVPGAYRLFVNLLSQSRALRGR